MATSATETKVANRWVIVVAAVVMQLALGAVYAWSVFVIPLQKLPGHAASVWTTTAVTLTFTIAIAILGVGAAVGGFWLDRVGPRIVATTAAFCYGLGVFLAGFSVDSLPLMYLSYGVLGGLGMGLGYIVPVATLVKWFPDRRGLVTGLAVFGFGGGAVLAAPVATALIGSSNAVGQTFIIMGIAYFIMVLVAAQFFSNPPAGYRPAGWTPTVKQTSQRAARDFTPGEALKRWQWYALWAILTLNVTAGIAIISQAKPIGIAVQGAPADTKDVTVLALATTFVTLIGVFNACGRFVWAWLSDLIGRRMVFLSMFILQAVLFALLAIALNAQSYAVLITLGFIVALCYGGGFGTMPAFTADYFGPKKAGSIYGLMLTAWSAGGILGPILIAQVKDLTKGYTGALYIIAGIMIVSALLPLLIRPPKAQQEEEVPAVSGQVQPA
jgi:OFA family oxalate/formate antiporter-like MFS transporter